MVEGAYITDTEWISENENSTQDDSFGALVNYFDDVNDKMDRIIKDIKELRYHSDKEGLSIDFGDEVLIDDEPDCEVDQPIEGARRSARINASTGVDRLDPTHGGKTHDKVKNNI